MTTVTSGKIPDWFEPGDRHTPFRPGGAVVCVLCRQAVSRNSLAKWSHAERHRREGATDSASAVAYMKRRGTWPDEYGVGRLS